MEVKISLIISTYNWVEALEMCLLSILNQSTKPFEILVADDGSRNETKELVDFYRGKFDIPLLHVWQEDKGFRLAKIRNKAILKSTGNFICQIDGDIILHKKFIEDYLKVIEPNYYYRGSRVKLNKELSEKICKSKQIYINIFTSGLENRFNSIRIGLLHLIMGKARNEYKRALGCNMGFWKEDLLKVNGYSNDLVGWGHEDEELCVRLINNGIFKKRIKHKAIVYHIHHEERNSDLSDFHDNLIKKVYLEGVLKTKNGLNELK